MEDKLCMMTNDLIENNILLNMSLKEDLDLRELTKLIKSDGLDINLVQVLKMENYNLLNITNLWKFRQLSTLVLANNLIEDIEGIEFMPNLQYIDLSFNRIKSIQGLKGLCNLVYLNLSFNEIATLKNMEHLKKLETLLVRNNRIESFEYIYYLKQFKNLLSVGVNGNPVMQLENARLHTIACLPQLKFLDFIMISSSEILEAFNQYPNERNQQFNWLIDKDENSALPWEKVVSDKEAFVDGLANGRGFDLFLNSDKNFRLLLSLPTALDIAEKIKKDMTEIFDLWHIKGHEYYKQMKFEKMEFIKAVKNAENFALSTYEEEKNNFHTFKEEIIKQLSSLYHENNVVYHMNTLKQLCLEELKKTNKNLLNISSLCIDPVYELKKIFSLEISMITKKYLQDVRMFCHKIMKIDEACLMQLKNVYHRIFDSGSNFNLLATGDDHTPDLDPKLLKLLTKKEFVDTALQITLFIHSSVSNERTRRLKSSLHGFLADTITQVIDNDALIKQDEWRRNIVIFCNKQKYVIEKLFTVNQDFM